MYKLLLIIIQLIYCSYGIAQQQNYLFQHLGIKDGLFEENVHAIQQDAKGFIWLNFRSLLQRYDGHRFINFLPGKQLPDGNIRSIVVDKKNRLWLLSGDASLGYLNPDNFKYNTVKVKIPRGFNDIVTGMYLDKKGEVVLIWSKQGFITYNDKTGIADTSNNPFKFPRGWEPIHLWQDDELNYWAGTANGLLKYNTVKKTISYRGHNEDDDPAINAFEQMRSINSVYIDQEKNCWVVSWEAGLTVQSFNIVSGQKKEWSKKISAAVNKYYVPFGFIETAGNHLWLLGSNLFCKVNTTEGSIQAIPNNAPGENSIRYDIIFFGFQDREKNIWLGTNKGLFRFNPTAQRFSVITNRIDSTEVPLTTEVTDFLETADGELLVSTWGNGVFAYNKKLRPTISSHLLNKQAAEGSMVWSMIQRANGDVWWGMQGGSVFIFEAGSKKYIREKPAVAEGKTIRQLAEDKNGNIWLGTQTGALIQWNAANRTFVKHQQFNGLVARIYVDAQNDVWVGTDMDGLYHINSSTGKIVQHYTSKEQKGKKLLINGMADILQYNDSIFYIAGNGLSILNSTTNSFQYLTLANGLPSSNITNLLKDRNGYIWMTTGAGIVSYHPEKQKTSIYTTTDGVHNYSFSIGAAAILKNGSIAFGTNHDFIVFHPDVLIGIKYVSPKVHIAGFEIQGQSYSVDSIVKLTVIELSAKQNSFKIQFATLRYQDLYPVQYMIEGIDKTWKTSNNENVVEYNYLPPGNYTLMAACFKEDGIPADITTITIHIAAPFYKTWWFYGLIVLAIGAGLFWLDKERMKRREVMSQMRTSIASNLHYQVNTALNSINILSEIAKIKADNEPEKSKEFIEEIHNKSQNTVIAMDDMLWGISPENDSMQKSVARMQEYIDALNNRYDANIEMLVDDGVNSLKLNMQLRYEAFLLFKEGITGLIKLGARSCKVYLRREKSHVVYIIECKNNSSDVQQLNYLLNGQEFKNRLKVINATMDIEVFKSISVLRCSIRL